MSARASSFPDPVSPALRRVLTGDACSVERPREVAPALRGRILLVEDDPILLRVMAAGLAMQGFEVVAAGSVGEARAHLEALRFDIVVSDILMEGEDGFDLHRALKRVAPETPLVFMTGHPTIETAAHAVECGALRYIMKPFELQTLVDTVDHAVASRREASARASAQVDWGRRALDAALTRAIAEMYMVFQPIVAWSKRGVVAYETLMRSRSKELPTPDKLLDAAERLGRLRDLGQRTRDLSAQSFARLPEGMRLFVNAHPTDLTDASLWSSQSSLGAYTSRVTIEVTERARLADTAESRANLAALQGLGYQLAIDDLGSGYSGLTSIAMVSPEVVKIDMSLVRDIDTRPTLARIVGSVVSLCQQMNIAIVAEGVERVGERDCLVDLGVDLFQGYYFARPTEEFMVPPPDRFVR